MTEIQEQVEQFIDEQTSGLPEPVEECYALLRAFLEECCDCVTMQFEETAIRRHFAWLEEK